MLPRAANPPFYDGVRAAANAAGITLRVTETPSATVEAALVAVASGRSPALLAASVAERHAFPAVRFLPLAEPAPCSTVALVTSQEPERIHVARFVRAAVAAARVRHEPMATRLAAASSGARRGRRRGRP